MFLYIFHILSIFFDSNLYMFLCYFYAFLFDYHTISIFFYILPNPSFLGSNLPHSLKMPAKYHHSPLHNLIANNDIQDSKLDPGSCNLLPKSSIQSAELAL